MTSSKRSRARAAFVAFLWAASARAAPPPPAPPAPESLAVVSRSRLHDTLKPTRRPRLVHVWATWCAPCVAEWPKLAELLRAAAPGGLDVVTVAMDDASRSTKASRVLADAGGVPGQAFLSPPAEAFPALQEIDSGWDGSIPTTYLLSSEGKLVHAQRGSTRLALLRTEIEKLAGSRARTGVAAGSNERRSR